MSALSEASLSWIEITKYDTSYLVTFLLGFLLKEIITFIKEGGLGEDYPLSRSLFYMLLCLVAFGLLAIPQFLKLRAAVLGLQKSRVLQRNDSKETKQEINLK